MIRYCQMLKMILEQGTDRGPLGQRNGRTRGLFGASLDVVGDFPLLTTKKINYEYVLRELLWFIRGDTNIKYLNDHGCHIWDKWADENGDLGPVYGAQWRNFNGQGIDQLENSLQRLCVHESKRDIMVMAWNPAQRDQVALPWCHMGFQLEWISPRYIQMVVYQRSADFAVGVPYNIASYATLLRMYCHLIANRNRWSPEQCRPGKLTFCFGDVHLYQGHWELAKMQSNRVPGPLPLLTIKQRDQMTFDDFEFEDFELHNYNPQPHIPYEVYA